MLKTFKPEYIIRLSNIKRSDYVFSDDLFDQKIQENITDSIVNTIIYDEIPGFFTTLEDYIVTTNLLCWYCDRSFTKRPIFISPTIRENCNIPEYEVYGNFCSFNCAFSYIDCNYCGYINEKLKDRLHCICKIFTGHPGVIISPAIPKTIMRQYGGDKSIDEYTKMMNDINPEKVKYIPILQERNRVMKSMSHLT